MFDNDELRKYVDFSKFDFNNISPIENHLITKYIDDPPCVLNGEFTLEGYKLKVEDLEKNYLSNKFFKSGCYDKIFEKMEAPEGYIKYYSMILDFSDELLLEHINEQLEYLQDFKKQLESEKEDKTP